MDRTSPRSPQMERNCWEGQDYQSCSAKQEEEEDVAVRASYLDFKWSRYLGGWTEQINNLIAQCCLLSRFLSFSHSFIIYVYLFIYLFIFLNSLNFYSIPSSFLPHSRLHFFLQLAIPVLSCVSFFSIRPSLSFHPPAAPPNLLFPSLLLHIPYFLLPVPLYSFLPASPLSLTPVLCSFLRSCLLHNSYSLLFTLPHTLFFLPSLSLHPLPRIIWSTTEILRA